MKLLHRATVFLEQLTRFPWFNTFVVLRERFR